MRAMRAMLCALLFLGLTGPAYAQDLNLGALMGSGPLKKAKTQDEVDADKQRNEDYSAAMKKMPDQNAKSDPWGSMRGGGADQKQSGQKKQAAPKPKQSDQKQAEQKQKPAGAQ